MIQEHWLTPDNLCKLNFLSINYYVFGSSAMNTFINDSNSMRSAINYMLTNSDQLIVFNVFDIDINLSDHIPILAICACDVSPAHL